MAQKVQVVLTCDLDEEEVPAAETVTFGFDGSTYAFELCEQHLEEVNEIFHAWIGAARAADGGRRRRAVSTPSAPSRARRSSGSAGGGSSDVRTWARDNGFSINERGRIPAEVRNAYEEAHR
ncbi:MAG: Lsr2 family protein [Actinomycetota bacterium]|nr:Lsr2 family protein [Actinomycetota bacterium]